MPAFGQSSAAKESGGWPREWANWSKEQMKEWLARQKQYEQEGDWGTGFAKDWNVERAKEGLGPIPDIRDKGNQLMPGVEDYISNQQVRFNDITGQYERVPKAADTMAPIDESQTGLAGDITRAGEQRNQEILDTAQRAMGREEAANKLITGDIVDRYGNLISGTKDAYGAMRAKVAGTYAPLKASAETAYDDILKDIEKLNPASEAAQARAARSFAPMMASTAGRMRRAGVGPASLQGLSAMQRVEAARSRAMDDAAIAGTEKLVDARTGATLGRQGARERLGLGELGMETGLAQEQEGITRGLTQEQGGLHRGEIVRSTGVQQAIDRDRSTRAEQGINTDFGRTLDWRNRGVQNELLRRGMNLEDWNTRANLLREQGANEKEGIGLRTDVSRAGMDFTAADLAEKNKAAANLGNYGESARNRMIQASQTGQGWGNTATENYATTYAREAPKTGWATKAIIGAAGAIPYVGPYISAAGGAATGQPAAGGAGGGGFDPWGFLKKVKPYGAGGSSGYGDNQYGGG